MADQVKLTDIVIIAITVLGLPAPFLVYWWSRRSDRKALTFNFSSAQLLNLDEDFSGLLRLTFNGIEVHDASIVTLTVKNSGRKTIKREDFEEGLEFRFIGSGQIMAFLLSDLRPQALMPNPGIRWSEHRALSSISFDPLLLNSGDEFSVVAIVRDFKGVIEARGRIAEVKDIKRVEPIKKSTEVPIGFLIALMGMLLSLGFAATDSLATIHNAPLREWFALGMAIVFGFGAVIAAKMPPFK
jgi:hypothetical protein